MQKHEEWLCEQLPAWEREGLIDRASAERLRGRYEAEANPAATGGNLAMVILSALGALLVGLGIIALFAANWGALSRGMRAGVSLLPLTICTLLALTGFARGWKARAFWEALGICWSLAIWSGFGLVCQTYHLSDDVRGFVLACTLLCLPVLYLTRSATATVVWPIYGLVWFCMDHAGFTPLRALVYLAMLAAHLPAFLLIHRQIRFPKLYEFFGTHAIAAGVISIIVACGEHWQDNPRLFFRMGSEELWLAAFLWTGAALWVLAERTQWRPMRLLGFLAVLPIVFAAPVREWEISSRPFEDLPVPPVTAMFGALTALVWIGGILLLLRKGEKQLPRENQRQIVVVLIALLAGIGAYLLARDFLLYLVVLVVASLALIQALRSLRLRQMNLALLVLIYEILYKYLDSDCSFTTKGITLLACGAALLSSNIFIIRGRRNMAAKEVAQ